MWEWVLIWGTYTPTKGEMKDEVREKALSTYPELVMLRSCTTCRYDE